MNKVKERLSIMNIELGDLIGEPVKEEEEELRSPEEAGVTRVFVRRTSLATS